MLLLVINDLTGLPLRDMIAEIWPVLAMPIAALPVMVLAPETARGLPRPFGRGG